MKNPEMGFATCGITNEALDRSLRKRLQYYRLGYANLTQAGGLGGPSPKAPELDAPGSTIKVSLMKTELVTTLKRKATDIIDALRLEREPVLITQHGKPAAYLVDVDTFEATQTRLSVLEGIAVGEHAVREGRVTSQAEARRRLSRWLA